MPAPLPSPPPHAARWYAQILRQLEGKPWQTGASTVVASKPTDATRVKPRTTRKDGAPGE